MTDLKKTITLMTSEDYKDRFAAEYIQTKVRYNILHKMLVKMEAGTLDFNPTCGQGLLEEQCSCMGRYLHCLEVRAEMEKINLEEYIHE